MAKKKIIYPVFRQPSQVTFGTGSARVLAEPDLADGAVWLISGHAAVRETLNAAFTRHGRVLGDSPVLEKPFGEPTRESVMTGAEWLAKQPPSRVIAVGGGSVLDWARLATAVAGGWLDLGTGTASAPSPNWRRPELVLVPTTCGSGAEAAAVAVYLADGEKRPIVSPHFIADRVVLDGQFLRGMATESVALFLCDALSHSIEAFVSIVPNELAKQAAASALPLILDHRHNVDHCSHERLMEAGYLAGVAASNCSVGVVHAFAHAVASLGVPHGVANGIGLSAGITTNESTDEMGKLLRRSGFASVDALRQAIRPVTGPALSSTHAKQLATVLSDQTGRQRIVQSMEADVCLRTNPRRLERADLGTFVDLVAADLHPQ